MRYLLLLLTLFIWACSPQNNETSKNPDVNIESASTSTLIEFGSLKTTDAQKLMSATIIMIPDLI